MAGFAGFPLVYMEGVRVCLLGKNSEVARKVARLLGKIYGF